MRFMMLVCMDDSGPEDDGGACAASVAPWEAEMERRGVLLGGERLRPSSEATSVRVSDGETLASDGPFAETKEQVAGYTIIECADLDEAIEVASAHPVARSGTVELRPIWNR